MNIGRKGLEQNKEMGNQFALKERERERERERTSRLGDGGEK